MNSISFSFFVTLYFVINQINCNEESINQTYIKIIKDQLVEKSSVNKLNDTIISLNSNLKNDSTLEDEIKSEISREDRGKICLRNVSECMNKDINYGPVMDILTQTLFKSTPPFDFSLIKEVSSSCRKQNRKYLNDLKKYKLWALKMYDANAKLPSGILNGNVNQLGDFDLCLGANSLEENISGQYCLTSIQIQPPQNSYLAALHGLAHSHNHFHSQLEDPGHRLPRFSTINWAVCVPNACTVKDIELLMKTTVNDIFKNTEFDVQVLVDPIMCQTNQTPIPVTSVIAVVICIIFLLFTFYATIYDHNFERAVKNDWIIAFSLKKNVNSLISVNKKSRDDIQILHGVRFLNSCLLILAHKSAAIFFIPFINRTYMTEFLGKSWTVLGRAASLYTDPFIMLSGTLTTYSLLGKLQKYKRINILEEYTSRLFRIVPALMAVIGFCTFILPWLNSGPMWNLVVTHHSNICKQNWWRNLFFIHNYFGFKDMCLTHTHHIGIDTQLFLVSPFLILILWKWPKNGTIFLIGLATLSTIMRYYVTYTLNLSNYVHFGISIKQLFDTADHMYILPAHRSTVYIMGILLGYVLRNFKSITLSQTHIKLGNAIALFSYLISFYGAAFMGSIDYVYNSTNAAWYAAFAPILWCVAFGWIIFTSHTGYKGFLENFLSWPGFSFWTKISYSVYLTQFPIFFYNVGTIRTAQHFEFFSLILNILEYAWIIGASVALTVLVEMPFQNIRNIIYKNKEIISSSTEETQKNKKVE